MIRILQVSDLHLGGPVLPSGIRFSREVEKKRQEEADSLLKRIAMIVRDEQVELVLIPGDLWDREVLSHRIVRDVIDWLGSLAPIPVIITPGNHDFLGPDSPYHPQVSTRYGVAWPENVTVVHSSTFAEYTIESIPDLRVFSMATAENRPLKRDSLLTFPDCDSERITLLMFHGSLVPEHALDRTGEGEVTGPYTAAQILETGCDLAVVGHYHRSQTVEDAAGRTRLLYSGAPFSTTFTDGESKGVFVYDLEKGGISGNSLRFLQTDDRRYFSLTLDLSSAENEDAVNESIKQLLKERGVHSEDLVRIHLTGRFGKGSLWEPATPLEGLCAGCIFDTKRLQSKFSLETALQNSPAGSVQSVFLKKMQQKLMDISGAVDETDLAFLQYVVQLGFDALTGEAVQIDADRVDLVTKNTLDAAENEEYPGVN